jgi:hypothetical protein
MKVSSLALVLLWAGVLLATLVACAPSPPPGPLTGVRTVAGEQSLSALHDGRPFCTALLHVELTLVGVSSALVASHVTIVGVGADAGLCDRSAWTLAAAVVCEPSCGAVGAGTSWGQTVSTLRFVRRPDYAHLRVNLSGTYAGRAASGSLLSDQIRCSLTECRFQVPSES